MSKKEPSEMRKKIHEMHEENEFTNVSDNTRRRARSVLVGTGYGGMIEISLRNEFYNMYMLLQPVEAVEFMEQIAAGCGIELAMRPKQNFTAWRTWDYEHCDNPHMKGQAPWQIEGNLQQLRLQEVREQTELEFEKTRLEMWKEHETEKTKKLSEQSQKQNEENNQEQEEEIKTTKKRTRKSNKTNNQVMDNENEQ